MKRAVYLNNTGDPQHLVKYAIELESEGTWDGLFLMDHLQISGDDPMDLLDPWVVLGAIASHTQRLMLGAMVTPISRRRPWQLAKEIVTLDQLSHGRVIVGIGLGGFEAAEFRAFGDDSVVGERAKRTDEALLLLDAFLRGEALSHHGEYYRLTAHLRPAAFQTPRPRIWIAATPPYRKPLERAQRWDGVLCNLKLKTRASGETRYSEIPKPQNPDELKQYVGDLPFKENFDVVAMRHPDYPPELYEEIGVTWLLDLKSV